jgi:drug/metabolite transporter (DMT)-like permease
VAEGNESTENGLSRMLLGERLNRFGAFVVLLSLTGAATMLWRPQTGIPLPRDAADWMGLGAGFCFALYNVLSRRVRDVPVDQRVMVSFAGVIVIGLILGGVELPATLAAPGSAWLLVGMTGVLLLAVNLVVQFGLANTPGQPGHRDHALGSRLCCGVVLAAGR